MQKRIVDEVAPIQKADENKPMLFDHILNPKTEMATPTSLSTNLFVGLDCEMD